MVNKIIAEAGATGNQCAKLTPNPAPVAIDGTKIPLGMPLKKVAQDASILYRGKKGSIVDAWVRMSFA